VTAEDYEENYGSWTMFGHDSWHSGATESNLVPNIRMSPSNSWSYSVNLKDNESISWSPAVTDGKNIYLLYSIFGQTMEGGQHRYESNIVRLPITREILADGSESKEFSVKVKNIDIDPVVVPGDRSLASPAIVTISGEPVVVCPQTNGMISFFDSNLETFISGKTVSDTREKGPILSSPTIVDGDLFIGSDDNLCVKFVQPYSNLTRKQYTNDDMGLIAGSPAVFEDYIIFGDMNGYIWIFNHKNQKLIEKIETKTADGKTIRIYSPTIAKYSNQYYAIFHGTYGHLIRVSLNKKTLGQTKILNLSSGSVSTPLVSGRYIYAGDSKGLLYKTDISSFEVIDSIQLDQGVRSQPILSNGFLYVTTSDFEKTSGSLYILEIDNESKELNADRLKKEDTSGSFANAIIVGDYLFVPTNDGSIKRFEGIKLSIKCSADSINFGDVTKSDKLETRSFTLQKQSDNPKTLSGTIEVYPDWIKLDRYEFSGDISKINVSIDPSKLPKGNNEGKIYVNSNAENVEIKVKVNIVLDFKTNIDSLSYKAAFEGKDIDDSFNLYFDYSDENISFDKGIMSDKGWITNFRGSRTLSSQRRDIDIPFTIKVSELPIGKHTAVISVESDQGVRKYIDVLVEITEQPPNPIFKGDSDNVTIPIENCFISETHTVKFIIENTGGRGISFDSESIETKNNWIDIQLVSFEDDDDTLEVVCDIDSYSAMLWPRGNDSDTSSSELFTVHVNGKPFNFGVKIVANEIDVCEIAFVIGSDEYTVNGRTLTVSPPPFISDNGNTMVPIRPIAEPLEKFYDADIEWVGELKTVLFTLGDTTLRLVIGYNSAILELPDGSINTLPMNSPPVIVNGRTFLPPRTIAEAFGAKVEWIADQRKAVFTFSKPN